MFALIHMTRTPCFRGCPSHLPFMSAILDYWLVICPGSAIMLLNNFSRLFLRNVQTKIRNHRHHRSPTALSVWKDKLMDWKVAGSRCAGISSFGFSGTNSHVNLQAAASQGCSCSGGVLIGKLNVCCISFT